MSAGVRLQEFFFNFVVSIRLLFRHEIEDVIEALDETYMMVMNSKSHVCAARLVRTGSAKNSRALVNPASRMPRLKHWLLHFVVRRLATEKHALIPS